MRRDDESREVVPLFHVPAETFEIERVSGGLVTAVTISLPFVGFLVGIVLGYRLGRERNST